MKIMSEVYWKCGKRAVNEDSVILQQVMTANGRMLLAAVSDGIGGLAEGQNASGYILERLVENFYNEILMLAAKKRGRNALKRSMLRCFFSMNVELNHYAKSRDIKLGATISVLLIWKHFYMIFHLGDSRIYLYRKTLYGKNEFGKYEFGKNQIRLLTQDHSDGGHRLTKCMGSFPVQYPDISMGKIGGIGRIGRIGRKSGFLLCTDGFYRGLFMEDTRHILAPSDIACEDQIKRRLNELGELSTKQYGHDNLTAVYVLAHTE